MRRLGWTGIGVAVAILCLGGANDAHGDVFQDVALALEYAGFNFYGTQNINVQGRENRLNGGIDFLTSVNFNGTPLDFGAWDLTMAGPVSFGVSTASRGINTLDISFQTALGADSIAQPLNYALNLDPGGQVSSITGSWLVDGDLSVNQFGFYDLSFTYSSRQDVTNVGHLANGQNEYDFDVGPIEVRGNIYYDVLAVLTAPLFDALGQPNLFTALGGNTQLNDILQGSTGDTTAKLAMSADPFAYDPMASFDLSNTFNQTGGTILSSTQSGTDEGNPSTIPEPTVLLLMLLGVPALLGQRRHR